MEKEVKEKFEKIDRKISGIELVQELIQEAQLEITKVIKHILEKY